MKLAEMDINKMLESKHLLELILSLSRGSKILKQILCEVSAIYDALVKQLRAIQIKTITEEQTLLLKVIANLTIDCKSFISQLPFLVDLVEEGSEGAMIIIKNMGQNLSESQAKQFYKVVDFAFISKFAHKEQGLLILRQACGAPNKTVSLFIQPD